MCDSVGWASFTASLDSLKRRGLMVCVGTASGPMGCVLRCVECPETGGDTIWANMVLAYEKLPEAVKLEVCIFNQ